MLARIALAFVNDEFEMTVALEKDSVMLEKVLVVL